MKRYHNILRLLALVVIFHDFSGCIPEKNDPQPDNYIINGPQDMYPSFSPDGEWIAYFHEAANSPPSSGYPSGLYVINKTGLDRKLVLEGQHLSPSWSPNGDWLVFSSLGIIQKCKLNGDSLKTFTGLDTIVNHSFYFPDWSVDGKYILFDQPFVGDGGIYSVSPSFSNPKRLTIDFGRDPELSPVNRDRLLYYRSGSNFEHAEIFVLDLSSLTETRLTQNDKDDRAPTWSPDGSQIVWSSSVRLSIMNADGSGQKSIGYGNDPSWSGQEKIVFSHANQDYTKEVLYLIDPQGLNLRQITF